MPLRSPTLNFSVGVSQYFLDNKGVAEKVNRMNRRNLYRASGLVRTIARRSLKDARRLTASDFTAEQLHTHLIVTKQMLRKGLSPPQWPNGWEYAPAKPGKPPRLLPKFRQLRNLLGFIVDDRREESIVGPSIWRGSKSSYAVPGELEHGLNHPFMGPALEKARPKLADIWRNSL